MNIYAGTTRRQVGGGIWSTIARGIRPILMNIYHTLKPGATVMAKKAAQSALNVGSNLAMDAIRGRMDTARVKEAFKDEAQHLTNEALTTMKRKLNDNQSGTGNKRRRLNPPRKAKMKQNKRKVSSKRKGISKRKGTSKRRGTSKRKPVSKRGKLNKRIKSHTKRKAKKRTTISKKVFKDIFNS